VDLYTYISKGHAIFATHQQKLYDYPANYLHFLFDRSVDKASHDNTRVNLAQTKEVDEFLHATSCAYMALESLIIDNHADVHGQCEKSRGSFGWSPITQLFHIACIFRFHLELVERLIYTLRDNDTRVVQSLKHIRHVPRTMAIADLCQATTTTTTLAPNSSILSASTEALLSNQTPLHNAAHEPMATRSTTSILPRQMCPLSLLHSANSLCPSIVCMGCVLYPDVQFGHYSQFQVYEQMSFISQRMYDIDITHNELVPFMRALHLRMCELLHFTYFAKCAWSPTALPNEISPSKPLDMLPPERYRLAHRFGGVPPQERSMTVDLSAVSQSNKNEPYKHKPDVADASDAISPARAFLDEMLGVIAPTFRQLVLVHNITSSETRLPPNTTSLTTQSYLDQKQQYLALLVDDCVQRYTPSKSINDRVGGEDDVGGRIDTMEISGSTTRPSISSLNGTPSTAHRQQWQQPRITFELLLDIFNTIMDHRRSRTIDLSYRDDLCTHMRRMCLPLNLPECYAHVPNNMFERTYNSEQLENAFLPRPVFQARNEQWRQLELHQLESEPYIPFVARTYAKMCIMRTLGFINGEDQSWVDNYAIFHYQLDQLADRMSLDDSPFVLILGSCCYVRRGQRFFECSDARQAMLVWLLFVGADFPTHHRRLVTTCVSTTTWISLLEQVIKNAVKSAASLQSRTGETSANAQSTVRCSDMFDGNLLSDVLGEISSDDDAAHDDDNTNTCNGGDSECEEEMLVKQFMQCDGFL
jgi:hypothetical protein